MLDILHDIWYLIWQVCWFFSLLDPSVYIYVCVRVLRIRGLGDTGGLIRCFTRKKQNFLELFSFKPLGVLGLVWGKGKGKVGSFSSGACWGRLKCLWRSAACPLCQVKAALWQAPLFVGTVSVGLVWWNHLGCWERLHGRWVPRERFHTQGQRGEREERGVYYPGIIQLMIAGKTARRTGWHSWAQALCFFYGGGGIERGEPEKAKITITTGQTHSAVWATLTLTHSHIHTHTHTHAQYMLSQTDIASSFPHSL